MGGRKIERSEREYVDGEDSNVIRLDGPLTDAVIDRIGAVVRNIAVVRVNLATLLMMHAVPDLVRAAKERA